MLYFRDINLGIFLIPKCGGQAVRHSLRCHVAMYRFRNGQCRHHRSSKTHCLPGHIQPPKDTKLAVFVRHPEAWYRSWWASELKSQARGKRQSIISDLAWHPDQALYDLHSDDFTVAMRNILAREPGSVTRLYEWYCGPEGAEIVDYVGQQEKLEDHLNIIARHCGYTGPRVRLGWPNRSPSATAVWDEAVKSALLATETPVIRRFYTGELRVRTYGRVPEPLES